MADISVGVHVEYVSVHQVLIFLEMDWAFTHFQGPYTILLGSGDKFGLFVWRSFADIKKGIFFRCFQLKHIFCISKQKSFLLGWIIRQKKIAWHLSRFESKRFFSLLFQKCLATNCNSINWIGNGTNNYYFIWQKLVKEAKSTCYALYIHLCCENCQMLVVTNCDIFKAIWLVVLQKIPLHLQSHLRQQCVARYHSNEAFLQISCSFFFFFFTKLRSASYPEAVLRHSDFLLRTF